MSSFEIGVTIPTWNSDKALGTALASLREQKGCHVEIVVADSGSTDGTLDLCRAFGTATVSVPPGNMYRAINEGLNQLHTPWLAYLNSDDFVFTDGYARLISKAEATGSDVAYGNGDFVDAHGRFLYALNAPRPTMLRTLFGSAFLGFLPHGAVFRKSVFEELGGFNEEYRHVADLDFFSRAFFAGRRFVLEPGASVAAFRIHQTQLSRKERAVVQREIAMWSRERRSGSKWAVWQWKSRNLRQYALRWLRTGSLRGYSSVS